MPLGGIDTRYDLPWAEQDKIRRRMEIRQRLKQEGIRNKWDPFLHMKKQIVFDPALDRYMDIRKRGRLPNTPMRPTMFYGYAAALFMPIIILAQLMKYERIPYLEGCKDGSIPYSDRKSKAEG